MKRIVVSAGDPSGDLMLAKIISAMREIDPALSFEGLCGPACEEQEVKRLANAADVAVVGIVEVLGNLRKIFGILDRLGQRLEGARALICVDFPDFNLRLAEVARKKNIPVYYVVAPQVWAWRSGRLPQIKRLVRRMYPALPFEQNIFIEAGVDTRFFGHPIRDLLPPKDRIRARWALELLPDDLAVALFPGSRTGEFKRHLSLIVQAWKKFTERNARQQPQRKLVGVLGIAPGWTIEKVLAFLKPKDRALVDQWLADKSWRIGEDSRKVLMAADFGWIASGTATLEAAYYGLPHILIYKLSSLSAFIIQSLTAYFDGPDGAAGLANILLERKVIPELLQSDLSSVRLAAESYEMLGDPMRLDEVRKTLRFLPKRLGEAGACKRIAADILGDISGTSP